MKETKYLNRNKSRIVIACLVCWVLFLVMLVSPSIIGGNDLAFFALSPLLGIAVILSFISAYLVSTGRFVGDARYEKYTSSPITKVLAVLVLAAIVFSTYSAIKSFGYSEIEGNFREKFIYENIASGVGFGAIVLTFILSALQKDIYWLTRKQTTDIDERQVRDRQEAFETSYKIVIFVVCVILVFLTNNITDVPAILENSRNVIPGHFFWIPLNFMIMLVALPLVVAAWRGRKL